MNGRETGKSMLEMIGVLAVIAVLTVAGVWGVKQAFAKHNANLLMEDVKFAGFEVVSALFDSLTEYAQEGMPLHDKFSQRSPYVLTAYPASETIFEILAQKIPYDVCEEVKKRKVEWLDEIKANGDLNVCQKDALNQISFFFYVGLSGQISPDSCQKDSDCGECGTCQKNRTCKYGIKNEKGKCYSCDETSNIKTSKEACDACPLGSRFMGPDWSGCSNCNTASNIIDVSLEECNKCERRYKLGRYCYLCPEEATLSSDRTSCDYPCETGQFFAAESKSCKVCAVSNDLTLSTQQQCAACPDNTRFWTNNSCYSCDRTDRLWGVQKEECNRCSNRYWTDSSMCVLCNNMNGVIDSNAQQAECLRCSRRYWNTYIYGAIGCYYCPENATLSSDKKDCSFDCGKGMFFAGGNAVCKQCGLSNTSDASTKSQCAVCPTGTRFWDGRYCVSCDSSGAVVADKEECLRCSNRYLKGKICALCPSGQYRTDDGLGCQ